ncbi:hypothetical protein [Qipengyuania oceanensis]|uniref:Uncharacterized protein n=1 Tax=Qipengyuania oceanensis TaxID=1463597 RepID=A0A844YD95_9SPHN|nr:hypothetical protein [Qipengyuania oceanensis]MXO61922.1 hypothetical protein [Qipengyuania oceanensis]
MIDNPALVLATCTAAAAAVNLAVLRFSPHVSKRLRHALSGFGPVVVTLAAHIGPRDSVVATGTDLLVLGGAALAGVAAAIGSTRYVKPRGSISQN